MAPGDWGATHVLSYEQEGRRVEELVRSERGSLYTVQEWAGHSVADWSVSRQGRLSCGGQELRGATLRPIVAPALSLSSVLDAVRSGAQTVTEVSERLGRDVAEVERSLCTLQRLGKVVVGQDGGIVLR